MNQQAFKYTFLKHCSTKRPWPCPLLDSSWQNEENLTLRRYLGIKLFVIKSFDTNKEEN